MRNKNPLVKPFLKWVGGKTQLLEDINSLKPKNIKTYYEPFVGGGSVFLNLQPKKIIINDYNSELINTYNVVKNSVDELIKELKVHEENNSKDYFYELREWDRNGVLKGKTDVERAGRFIYLNKTCYNGMFRVNSQGQFNVPYGRYKNPNIVNEEIIRADSMFLNKHNVVALNMDFEKAVEDAEKGDFVYFDPPYAPITDDSQSFVGYTLNGFGNDEQIRLRDLFLELSNRGVNVMLSNSSTEFIHDIYSEYKDYIHIVKAKRSINSKGDGRGKVDEVIITNYKKV